MNVQPSFLSRGRKSRNTVSVGEPAEGSPATAIHRLVTAIFWSACIRPSIVCLALRMCTHVLFISFIRVSPFYPGEASICCLEEGALHG